MRVRRSGSRGGPLLAAKMGRFSRAPKCRDVGARHQSDDPHELCRHRPVRHSDPKITTEVYGHVVPGFLRDAIDQLKLGDPAPFVTPLLPAAENTVDSPEVSQEHAPDSESLKWR